MKNKKEIEKEINYRNDLIRAKKFMVDVYTNELQKYTMELNELKKELEELDKPKRWKPEDEEIYYSITSLGHLGCYCFINEDDLYKYKTYNCFKTQEEAKEHLEMILFNAEVREFIEQENDGWEPDFELTGDKYYLFKNCQNNLDVCEAVFERKTSLNKYFKSIEIGEKILAKFDNEKLKKWWI